MKQFPFDRQSEANLFDVSGPPSRPYVLRLTSGRQVAGPPADNGAVTRRLSDTAGNKADTPTLGVDEAGGRPRKQDRYTCYVPRIPPERRGDAKTPLFMCVVLDPSTRMLSSPKRRVVGDPV